eukprot:724080-Alexandrium_andersonii.AAC.1
MVSPGSGARRGAPRRDPRLRLAGGRAAASGGSPPALCLPATRRRRPGRGGGSRPSPGHRAGPVG